MSKFILVGQSANKAGVLINIEHIKFMHVLKIEDKRFAVQMIFATNESYVTEEVNTERKAMDIFAEIMDNIYGVVGPDSMSCNLSFL